MKKVTSRYVHVCGTGAVAGAAIRQLAVNELHVNYAEKAIILVQVTPFKLLIYSFPRVFSP